MYYGKAIKQFKSLKKIAYDKNMRLAAEWDENWKVLIATILSAVTRDEVTIEVCEKLFKKYSSMKKLSRARVSSVEKIINRVNFYKKKSLNIITTAKILHGVEIPQKIEELVKLPGVGRKVANVYLVQVHNAHAIAVDTHVARISFKLGWTSSKNHVKIEKDLEELFPKKYWREINGVLVRFGKSYGLSRRREDEILAELI